jgi:hypothetical protein
MSLLPCGPRRREALKGSHQGLVIRENVKFSTLQQEPEVAEGEVDGQKLPVEG